MRSAVRVLARFLLCVTALASAPGARPALADDWPGPQIRETFSESRQYFVRVIPGRSIGDSFGFRGMQKGAYSTAEFYRREPDRSYRLLSEATLKNPMAPAEFFVSNEGSLATVDNWHNAGYGQVVSLYDRSGRLVRSYDLAELFPAEDIKAFPRTPSSIEWRAGPAFVRGDQRTLLVTARGGDFVFTLDSGEYKFCEFQEKSFRCRTSVPPRR
jgi:hypothetical protein